MMQSRWPCGGIRKISGGRIKAENRENKKFHIKNGLHNDKEKEQDEEINISEWTFEDWQAAMTDNAVHAVTLIQREVGMGCQVYPVHA